MNFLVLGKGGREHALCAKLKSDMPESKVYCMPGNAGMAQDDILIHDSNPENFDCLINFIQSNLIDLVIVGPENLLEKGIVDFLRNHNILVFGPTKVAAMLETSKCWAKQFMKKYSIPTANFHVFNKYQLAVDYINNQNSDCSYAIKESSLCSGKGVFLVHNKVEAIEVLSNLFNNSSFSINATEIVIEEFLHGQELSLFAICNKKDFFILGHACDYKKLGDGNVGPNTGGMGCFSDKHLINDSLLEKIKSKIIIPTLDGMIEEGAPFSGVLFLGIMLTKDGPKVIEYNVRFGDPETQTLLPNLSSDFTSSIIQYSKGTDLLNVHAPKVLEDFSVHVVLVSKNYPAIYGEALSLGNEIKFSIPGKNKKLFFSGVKKNELNKLINDGGRVLGVTGLGKSIDAVREDVYDFISQNISFDGSFYRRDIGIK